MSIAFIIIVAVCLLFLIFYIACGIAGGGKNHRRDVMSMSNRSLKKEYEKQSKAEKEAASSFNVLYYDALYDEMVYRNLL